MSNNEPDLGLETESEIVASVNVENVTKNSLHHNEPVSVVDLMTALAAVCALHACTLYINIGRG